MSSRRKQHGDRSRIKSPSAEVEVEVEAGERKRSRDKGGGSSSDTPSKANPGRKLTRGVRPGVDKPPSQGHPTTSTKNSGGEESCSHKKTPRRLSKSNQWSSTLNSPSNDAEQQQEIFWDPHSPTPYKLENGKKKPTGSKCTVDISDIVNRIAPKNEKPANSDVAFLGMWIGEDAIPSTPGIIRARTKINSRPRMRHKEEELMKLAKQFDRNLVDAVQFQDHHDDGLILSDDKVVNGGNLQNNDLESFLEDIPEEDIALALKSVSQSSSVGASSYCENSSQKPVDQKAEAALNALFDSSTQKCSGRLSQSLSEVSMNSLRELPINVKANTGENAMQDNGHKEFFETPTNAKQDKLQTKCKSDTFHTPKRNKLCVMPKETSGHKAHPVLSSNFSAISKSLDDFEDEWGTDVLEDDSFVMQITQNPDLIATPKQDRPIIKQWQTALDSSITCNASENVIANIKSPVTSKLNNFKFVPRKLNECEGNYAKSTGTDEVENKNAQHNVYQKSNPKTFSSTVSRIPLKTEVSAVGHIVAKHSNNTPVSKTEPSLICEFSKNYNTNAGNLCLKSSSSLQKNNIPMKTFIQTLPQKKDQADTSNKASVQLDEWDDPKFSDEILDMFCESNSIWVADGEDDDLLYQVCDDVEKLTQTQEANEGNKKPENIQAASSNCNNEISIRARTENLGLLSQQFGQSKHESHISPSTTASYVEYKFKGNAVHYNRSTNHLLNTAADPANVIGHGRFETSSNNLQNDSWTRTNQDPVKFNGSNTVPVGGECSSKRTMLNKSHSQNILKPKSSTFIVTTSAVPSNFSFTKIKHSQVTSAHTNHTSTKEQSRNMHLQDLRENRNQVSTLVQGNLRLTRHPPLKRQLSESFIQSTKVFVAEEINKKCSMEEIERKKQDALARRKMRVHSFSSDAAPS
ncbi:ewing's tumor-associated antigen 1 isoform X2 [Ascaphus truei]|uniref:ewing's tumor-associated antigen 1 isoform X2 n=1 Tax=Ascaphus truei TaxID=8439 RepID=UPI003F5A3956